MPEQAPSLTALREDDIAKHIIGGGRTVELAAAVIGDGDGVTAGFHRAPRIIHIATPLQDQLSVPMLLNPFHRRPVEAKVELLAGPGHQRGEIVNALGVTDDIAEATPPGAQHA